MSIWRSTWTTSVYPEDYLETSLALGPRLFEAGIPGAEVVILNEAPLPLLGRIIRQRIVIYSRDESARVAFESLKYREFLDFDFPPGSWMRTSSMTWLKDAPESGSSPKPGSSQRDLSTTLQEMAFVTC